MMSAKLIVLFAVIVVAHCRVKPNPLYRHLDEVTKREPGACQHECVPICYDSSVGSYNHRSGTCSGGNSCCEWVTFKRETDVARREPGACQHECVPICYDSSVGSYNHRSGTCSGGNSCCEWVTFKRDEAIERLAANPLYRHLDEVAKREPGACQHECVPICYDSSVGSYNHRSGTCSGGNSCCEWVTFKRDEAIERLAAAKEYAGNLN